VAGHSLLTRGRRRICGNSSRGGGKLVMGILKTVGQRKIIQFLFNEVQGESPPKEKRCTFNTTQHNSIL